MRKICSSSLFCVFVCVVLSCSPPAENSATDTGVNAGVFDAGPDMVMRPAMRVRIATFNVGRFFDAVCDSNNCGDQEDFERQLSEAEFAFKADQIAGAIEEMNPDVIALQELETQACVDALAERLPNYSTTVFGEIGGTATLDVAVFARDAALLETRTHRESEQLQLSTGGQRRFAREFLEVHLGFEGERVVMFNGHFKAKRNDNPAWRLAEAEKARELVEATAAEFPEALVVMGGDLNDEIGSDPLIALTGDDGLQLVTRSISSDDAWTFQYFSDRILIDHLLYPENGAGEYADGTVEVVRDASGTLGGSDHAAVVAEFDVWLD